MKYILMMNGPKAGVDTFVQWPIEALKAHVAFMHALNKELKEEGAFVSAEGLAFPQEAKIVRAGADGLPVTDGVFPESKEFLMGYWIVDVEDAEQAYRIAARVSVAPGPGGKPLYIPVEVRQVMGSAPKEWQ
jgi:hypothetical protein